MLASSPRRTTTRAIAIGPLAWDDPRIQPMRERWAWGGSIEDRHENARWSGAYRGDELVGCFSIQQVWPQIFLLDFYVVNGRWGVVAAYAMLEKIESISKDVVGIISPANLTFLNMGRKRGWSIGGIVMKRTGGTK